MNENIKYGAGAVAVVGLSVLAVVYRDKWWHEKPPTKTPAAAVPAPAAPPPVVEEPAVKHPLPEAPAPEPLPPLAESDEPVQNALAGLFGKEAVEKHVLTQDLVRHIVTTVDNLPEQKLAERIRPVQRTSGRFMTGGSEETLVLDEANYARYKPAVDLVAAMDTQQLVTTYQRYYPLFQEAYANLGHPPEYFNDRVIEVIDHLLAAPELQGPVKLTRPGVQYEYADPLLESRSAGQKLLIRMGSDNARVIKDKLRELRAALAATPAANQPAASAQ
jgi:hypothetical protein